MAKRKKTMLVLIAVLVVAVIGIVAEKAYEKHVDTVNTVDEEVFTTSADDLTSINISYNDNELTFNKDDDGNWTYSEDEDFPVNQDKMSELIGYFESVHASFVIEDVEDYSQYGLKNPEAVITFTTADGSSEVEFGTYSTMDSKRYISVDNGDVYLIDEDILENVSSERDDYLNTDSVYDYDQITELKARGEAKFDVVYDADTQYTYTDSYNYYLVDGSDHLPVAESKVTDYINQIKNMDYTNYETYKASADDLAKYGLDDPDITVKITGEITQEDSDDTEEQSQKIYFSSVDDKNYYAYFDGSTIVYSVDESVYEALAEGSYETLRPDEILSLDWTQVDSLSVTVEDESYQVDVEADDKNGNSYTVGDESVDFGTVASKIDGLTLTEAGDDYSKGKQELKFTVTLADDDATQLEVAFYQYDGDSCVATLDGTTIGLVDRSSMSTLREEITSAILNKGKDATEDQDSNQ